MCAYVCKEVLTWLLYSKCMTWARSCLCVYVHVYVCMSPFVCARVCANARGCARDGSLSLSLSSCVPACMHVCMDASMHVKQLWMYCILCLYVCMHAYVCAFAGAWTLCTWNIIKKRHVCVRAGMYPQKDTKGIYLSLAVYLTVCLSVCLPLSVRQCFRAPVCLHICTCACRRVSTYWFRKNLWMYVLLYMSISWCTCIIMQPHMYVAAHA